MSDERFISEIYSDMLAEEESTVDFEKVTTQCLAELRVTTMLDDEDYEDAFYELINMLITSAVYRKARTENLNPDHKLLYNAQELSIRVSNNIHHFMKYENFMKLSDEIKDEIVVSTTGEYPFEALPHDIMINGQPYKYINTTEWLAALPQFRQN